MWDFSPCGATAQIWPRPPLLKFLDHTQLDTHTHTHTLTHTHTHTHTHSLTHPVALLWTSDQPFAKAAIYTTRNNHNKRTFIPLAGLEAAIPAIKRLHTHALDRKSTGMGNICFIYLFISLELFLSTHCRCRGLLLHLITLQWHTHTHTHTQTYKHTHTHSVGLLWTSDQPVIETST